MRLQRYVIKNVGLFHAIPRKKTKILIKSTNNKVEIIWLLFHSFHPNFHLFPIFRKNHLKNCLKKLPLWVNLNNSTQSILLRKFPDRNTQRLITTQIEH